MIEILKGLNLQKFNDNIEELIEVLKDTNFLIGKLVNYKVSYEEKKEDK